MCLSLTHTHFSEIQKFLFEQNKNMAFPLYLSVIKFFVQTFLQIAHKPTKKYQTNLAFNFFFFFTFFIFLKQVQMFKFFNFIAFIWKQNQKKK